MQSYGMQKSQNFARLKMHVHENGHGLDGVFIIGPCKVNRTTDHVRNRLLISYNDYNSNAAASASCTGYCRQELRA